MNSMAVRWRRIAAIAALAMGVLRVGPVEATAAEPGLRAGVATVDITPDKPIWLAGYAARRKPSTGVALKLYCKALAIDDGDGGRVVLVTADILGYTRAVVEPVAERARRELGLRRDQIAFSASHTHAGPVIREQLFDMYALEGANLQAVLEYNDRLGEETFRAIRAALADLKPARLAYGRGKAGFAMNRRGFSARGVSIAWNPDGPVDHDVPVLRVSDEDDNVRAVLFGYACHCTTTGGSFYEVCSDYAGYAQKFIEDVYPGATAMFMTGCGGDANPHPRGTLALARRHGLELAGAVTGTLTNGVKPIRGSVRTRLVHVDAPLDKPPSRAEFERRAKEDPNIHRRRHARRQLAILDEKGTLPSTYAYPIQAVQIGDELTMILLGGEVVVDYSHRLKRELGPEQTWVTAYTNDVFAYIPSIRVLLEGGYEADSSMIYYGLPGRWHPDIEDLVVSTAKKLAAAVRSGE